MKLCYPFDFLAKSRDSVPISLLTASVYPKFFWKILPHLFFHQCLGEIPVLIRFFLSLPFCFTVTVIVLFR